jgi:hypothetical protein
MWRFLKQALSGRYFGALAGLFAALLMLPAVNDGFQLDDHYQRVKMLGLAGSSWSIFEAFDGDPITNHGKMERGVIPWWADSRLRHSHFRYLAAVTTHLDFAAWPDRPALMHMHSIAWLVGLVLAVSLLYRKVLGPTWLAGLATLLYAVDDAHAMPTAYLANRSALLATCFGAVSVWAFARWRADAWARGAWVAPLFLALALGSAEIGLATTAYLFSYVVFLDRGSFKERAKSLLPCVVVGLAWAGLYLTGNFGASESGVYREPFADPTAYVAGLLWRAPILLLGQWTPIPADVSGMSGLGDTGLPILIAMGTLVTALVGLTLVPVLRTNASARFWGLGMLLSVLPVAAAGPQNRLLFFVGIGAMGLVAELVGTLVRGEALGRVRRGLSWGVLVLLLLSHLVLSPLMFGMMLDLHARAAEGMQRALDSVAAASIRSTQTLVVVNPPDYTYTVGAIPAVLDVAGLPVPKHVRGLSAGTSEVEITRTDAKSLRVVLPKSLFPSLFSHYYRAKPFADRERVELSGFVAEVERRNAQGSPEAIAYRFRERLEDASLAWLRWQDGAYVTWSPPAVGETVVLPPSRSIFSP